MVKNLPTNAGDKRRGLDPWGLERPLEEGMAHSLQYSCLENPVASEA